MTHDRRTLLLGAALLAHVFLAWDGRLYWHDVRYLWATQQYELAEIFAGAWDPQYGEALDAKASGAFYLAKASFVAALDALFAWVPADVGGLELATGLSLGLVASVPLLGLALLRRSLGARDETACWHAAALLYVSPTLPYVGGKLVAEVLALPLALLTLLLAEAALRRTGVVRLTLWAGAAIAHVIAVNARPNLGVLAPAFWIAAAAGGLAPHAQARTRAWLLAAAAIGLQLASHALLFSATGVGLAGLLGYLGKFTSAGRSAVVSVIGALLAAGALLPLAALGARASATPRRFAIVWLLLTLVPTLAVFGTYQIEARYLVAPLLPLALLAGLGTVALTHRFRSERSAARRVLAGGALALGVFGANAVALSALPYEVDRRDLGRLLASGPLRDSRAALLVPWAYSDFHYLVALAPEREIYFVHVPRVDGRLAPYDAEWRERLRAWYGDRVLLDASALAPLLARGPVYYLRWGVHPPLERWAERLRAWGLGSLAERVRALAGAEHGDQSWVVEEPTLARREVAHAGIYRLDRVEAASYEPGAAPRQPAQEPD